MGIGDWIALGGVIVAIATAWYGVVTSLYVRRREFEDIYVQRYWEISGRIPLELRMAWGNHKDVQVSVEQQGQSVKEALWDYLMLCEDEFDMRKAGNVTDETWAIWGPTIYSTMGNFPFKEIFLYFEDEMDRRGIPKANRPFSWIRRITNGEIETDHDPLTTWPLLRIVKGQRQRIGRLPKL